MYSYTKVNQAVRLGLVLAAGGTAFVSNAQEAAAGTEVKKVEEPSKTEVNKTTNPYAPGSIANPYGTDTNVYAPGSIANPYGT